MPVKMTSDNRQGRYCSVSAQRWTELRLTKCQETRSLWFNWARLDLETEATLPLPKFAKDPCQRCTDSNAVKPLSSTLKIKFSGSLRVDEETTSCNRHGSRRKTKRTAKKAMWFESPPWQKEQSTEQHTNNTSGSRVPAHATGNCRHCLDGNGVLLIKSKRVLLTFELL